MKLLGAPSPTLDFVPDALEAILSFVQIPWELVFSLQHRQLPIAFPFQSPLLLEARGLSMFLAIHTSFGVNSLVLIISFPMILSVYIEQFCIKLKCYTTYLVPDSFLLCVKGGWN